MSQEGPSMILFSGKITKLPVQQLFSHRLLAVMGLGNLSSFSFQAKIKSNEEGKCSRHTHFLSQTMYFKAKYKYFKIITTLPCLKGGYPPFNVNKLKLSRSKKNHNCPSTGSYFPTFENVGRIRGVSV